MKGKYTLLLVAALLVAGGLYFFLQPGSRTAGKDDDRPYAKLTADDWRRLEIRAPEKKPVTLVRREGKWHLEGREQCRVKKEMVDQMLAALGKMRFDDLVTSNRKKFAEYHVDEQKGILVSGQTARGPVKLVIGKVAGDFLHTYVKPGDREAVYRINGMPAHLFSHDPDDFCQPDKEKDTGQQEKSQGQGGQAGAAKAPPAGKKPATAGVAAKKSAAAAKKK
ncbi:MAG: DUF4340 domain-containing protein [Deltaproteobacteria bacterium]|nr:DUF4340 domain-containing protein [Deltaproteobacteria bacterium]